MDSNKKGTLYFMVGIPASGKSTYAEKLSARTGAKILSSDALREEITGNAGDTNIKPFIIFTELRKRVDRLLSSGQDVICDATGINQVKRREDINHWKEIGAKIIGVIVGTEFEIVKERNKNRKRVVINSEMDRFHDWAMREPVDVELDLFDEIIAVDKVGNEGELYNRKEDQEKKMKIYPEFNVLKRIK